MISTGIATLTGPDLLRTWVFSHAPVCGGGTAQVRVCLWTGVLWDGGADQVLHIAQPPPHLRGGLLALFSTADVFISPMFTSLLA